MASFDYHFEISAKDHEKIYHSISISCFFSYLDYGSEHNKDPTKGLGGKSFFLLYSRRDKLLNYTFPQ